jgi:hypothetical protein
MPPRALTPIHSIQEACYEVCHGQQQGKPAIQLISMTDDCTASDAVHVQVFTTLIMSSSAVAAQAAGIFGGEHYLLTIEDFVWRQGQAWGFTPATIQRANLNAQNYDSASGLPHPRYA